MPKVSQYPLDPQIDQELARQFWQTLDQLGSQKLSQQFFTDLLTPTEITMLAKRLAVAILLYQGKSQREIKNSLNVSFTKTGSVANWLKNASPQTLQQLEKLSTQTNWQKFSHLVDKLLIQLFSPYPTHSPTSRYIKSSKFASK